jgi:two-component system response regulator PilR (NtrC family)
MNTCSANILVVDDELSMRELLDVMLTQEGYGVSLVNKGKQALKIIEKKSFDMILCDIRLGDLTGLDILRAAKQKNSITFFLS